MPPARMWPPQLLAATPNGSASLGELVESPGHLATLLAVETVSGLLGALEYPVALPRELLAWFIDYLDRLTWPEGEAMSSETLRLRGPCCSTTPLARRTGPSSEPGSCWPPALRCRRPGGGSRSWPSSIACSITDPAGGHDRRQTHREPRAGHRLVSGALGARSQPRGGQAARPGPPLGLLAAVRRAVGGRDRRAAGADNRQLRRRTCDAAGRDQLLSAYLGNLTLDRAAAAVGVSDGLHDPGFTRTN